MSLKETIKNCCGNALFFKKNFFCWNRINLQCCVTFHCTAKCETIHVYVYLLFFFPIFDHLGSPGTEIVNLTCTTNTKADNYTHLRPYQVSLHCTWLVGKDVPDDTQYFLYYRLVPIFTYANGLFPLALKTYECSNIGIALGLKNVRNTAKTSCREMLPAGFPGLSSIAKGETTLQYMLTALARKLRSSLLISSLPFMPLVRQPWHKTRIIELQNLSTGRVYKYHLVWLLI